jgi:hypothetical protein
VWWARSPLEKCRQACGQMTEQEYGELAAACDRLLRAPSTSLARLAIPVLHFLNEHPSSLAQYASLPGVRAGGRFSHLPKAVIRSACAVMRSLTAPRLAALPQAPIDVVIVSHLLRPDQLRRGDDFYFGALQTHLKDQGFTSLLVLISHLTVARSDQDTQSFQFPRTILPATVSPATEVDIWRQCASAGRTLRREAARARNSADNRLAMLASRQALSASTVSNLRMHAAVAKICQAVNPKIIITTYEGTVAERLIWHAARTARRRPLCVGYQHAMVLERAHAIRRPVAAPGIDCDPDAILTLGEITHAALAAGAGLQSVRFIGYGTHRRATLPLLPQPQHRPRHCLVLPDASHDECAALFGFALDCARRSPDISFALRPHPMVDIRLLLRRLPFLQNLPGNVALSVDKPLEQEFARTRYCLYRGSSAAMHAVRAGIKPYYFARPGELPFDCLFELGDWRETVTSPQDLLDRMGLADQSMDSAAATRAVSICERYVAPVRPAALNELLAMVSP